MENIENIEEKSFTGKYIMIVLNGEILSIIQHEGVTEITSEESSHFTGDKETLKIIANTLNLKEINKLDEI